MLNKPYGMTSKLLHQAALGSSIIAEASFDLEQAIHKPALEASNQHPVFISGLARSGTTILLRSLYQTQAFRSLTYRDMPFILMPITWQKLSATFRQSIEPQERSHADSIDIDYDSPEAFEEVFWKAFCDDQYIKNEQLQPHRPGKQTISNFKRFVASILSHKINQGNLRYLSKNNNNILRLTAIEEAFPESTIIIPFRHPLQQASSLLKQHQNFLTLHQQDSYGLKYMNWLGHYEFGLNHKPFSFGADQHLPPIYDKNTIEYWLQQWVNAYRYLLKTAPKNAVFLCYEELSTNPEATLEKLFEILALPLNKQTNTLFQPQNYAPKTADQQLLELSQNIYDQLVAIHLK